MLKTDARTILGALVGLVMLSAALAGPVIAQDGPGAPEPGADDRIDPADADRVRTKSIALPPGEALVVSVDLVDHALTLQTIPLDPLALPLEGHEDDPNCLSTERSAWVQVDQPLNQNGPGAVGEVGVPGFTGNCRTWGGMERGVESLTFILAERFGGRVDGVDEPTQSFIVVECDGSGFAFGPLLQDDDPVTSMSCEYRQSGAPSSGWTQWDSRLLLRGQTVTGSGYGFGYALFE